MGIFADAYVGGNLGPGVKFAGYDPVVVKSKASKLAYLYINSRKASMEDASEVWGKVEAIEKQKFSKVVKEAGGKICGAIR